VGEPWRPHRVWQALPRPVRVGEEVPEEVRLGVDGVGGADEPAGVRERGGDGVQAAGRDVVVPGGHLQLDELGLPAVRGGDDLGAVDEQAQRVVPGCEDPDRAVFGDLEHVAEQAEPVRRVQVGD